MRVPHLVVVNKKIGGKNQRNLGKNLKQNMIFGQSIFAAQQVCQGNPRRSALKRE
jgi:hypothetical protein